MKIGIFGLGYVGLPLAITFQKKFNVIGYDLNPNKVDELNKNHDKNHEISARILKKTKKLIFTSDINLLKDCKVIIIAVPTPINKNNSPDLTYLKMACIQASKIIKKGTILVFESTVYPGVTEEFCVPIIEKLSKLKYNKDFYCGYSPERINPGDKIYNIENIVKLTSGSNKKISNFIDKLYKKVIKAGTFKASSIKVAEAAKSIENAQRDINIAFVNELKIIFDRMGLDTFEILKAAGTKWNFLKFEPGLVGGHCIGVDPYYLSYISKKFGHNPKVILSGRKINDNMHKHVVSSILKKIDLKKKIKKKKILILGFTFKENCKDFRNSKIVDIYLNLKKNCLVDIYDPIANQQDVFKNYQIKLQNKIKRNFYDAVLIGVKHNYFKKIGLKKIKSFCKKNHVIYDFKNLFRH